MKYNVGDRVRVRRDLKGGIMYGGTYMNPLMEKYCGCVFTVSGTGSFGYKLEGCKWDEYGASWEWSKEMLEPITIVLPQGVKFKWCAPPKTYDPPSIVEQACRDIVKEKEDTAMQEYARMCREENARATMAFMQGHRHSVKAGELREIFATPMTFDPVSKYPEIETRKKIRKRLLKL